MANKKNESSNDFIVKLIIFLGAVAAIFVAASMLYRKCNKHLNCLNDEDAFNFEDEDFIDDCDYCGGDEEPAEDEAEEV